MHCHRAVRHIVLVAVAWVVSCDKSTAPRSTVPVASVTVSPAAASIALGQTVQLTPTPRHSQGNRLARPALPLSPRDPPPPPLQRPAPTPPLPLRRAPHSLPPQG